jgi:hypothetical protein
MGCLAMLMQRIQARLTRYIAVESDQVARVICQNCNPAVATFPGVDHRWQSDVFAITEASIAELGFNAIKLLGFGPPCEDQSKLRLIRSKAQQQSGKNPRPGLDGPKGAVFRQCLLVLCWVRKHNPAVEVFAENPDFADLAESWDEVCHALGEPLMIAHDDFSTTARFRAYWLNNIALGLDFTAGFGPLEPNDCTDPGRAIRKYTAHGKQKVYPICKSWKGDDFSPEAATSRPILVDDDNHQLPQHLRVHEAESLHDIEQGRTAGRAATPKQRLKCIGNGWDLRVVFMLLRYSKLSRVHPDGSQSKQASQSPQTSSSLLPTTKQPVYCQPHKNNQSTAAATNLLLRKHSELGTPAFASYLAQLRLEQQLVCLGLVKDAVQGGADSGWSVLDSGSSRHLNSRAHITDADDRKSLVGFNGSSAWSDGNGYLPLEFTDDGSGLSVKYDIPDVDSMQVRNNILCLGKLLRLSWDFHFTDSGNQCVAISPCKAFTVRVQLGDDDIMRMSHKLRRGSDSIPIPGGSCSQGGASSGGAVLTLKRSAGDAAYDFLHPVFNHCGDERLYQTLGHTRGYVQVRLSPKHCNTCAIARARGFGLKQRTLNATVNLLQHLDSQDMQLICAHAPRLVLLGALDPHPVFTDDSAALDDEDDPPFVEFDYKAPVAGRQLGVQPVPRFQLYKLRKFEVMFADNKDFPCPVRGGHLTCFLLVCYKTRMKAKVDLHSKTENGVAFQRIVALHGVHKLDYSCRVWTDGCGSMNLVKAAASRAGLDHAFVPPHQQSLNEAEKVCDQMFAAARAHMVHSQAPDSLFSKAVDFAIYSDARTSTTESRGWVTPYEAVQGQQPDVRKMHRFYTRCFVTVPASKRKELAKRQLHNYRSEPGRFIGFQSVFSSTYAVMLDKIAHSADRLVHSIDVTFDDTDYVRGSPPAQQQPPDVVQAHFPAPAALAPAAVAPAEEADSGQHNNPLFNAAFSSPQQQQMQGPYVQIEPIQWPLAGQALPDYHDPNADAWMLNGDGTPQARPRPSYSGMANTVHMVNSVIDNDGRHSVLDLIKAFHPSTLGHICLLLADHSQKDMSWQKVLQGPKRGEAIEALHKELNSLCDTILEEILPNHPDRARAEAEAISGRFLLDLRRNQELKARGVKHGFKEDKATADGIGFNYSAHVTRLKTIRLVILRRGRGNRRLAIKDVRVAFLQSDGFPDQVVKFLVFKWPLTGEKRYFRQLGPIYGESSAPIRWEDTFCPFLEDEGFDRGDHDRSAFHHRKFDLVDLLWVDDNMLDGEEDHIKWASQRMDKRFDCKGLVWIEPMGKNEDCIGMEISMDANFTYMSMCQYIWNCIEVICDALGISTSKFTPVSTPMDQPIDPDSSPLDAKMSKLFMTATGFLGWLQLTVRIDVSLLYS